MLSLATKGVSCVWAAMFALALTGCVLPEVDAEGNELDVNQGTSPDGVQASGAETEAPSRERSEQAAGFPTSGNDGANGPPQPARDGWSTMGANQGAGAAGSIAQSLPNNTMASLGGAGAPSPSAGNSGLGAAAGSGGSTSAPMSAAPGEPLIPEVNSSCPQFRTGTIAFLGLGGIKISAGAKASQPTAPLVFYWHGTNANADEYTTKATALHQRLTEAGGVLISFQGTSGGDLLSGTAVFGKDDLMIADQLVACAVRDHNVDPHRVFATGCDGGGLFATAQAALRSSYVAAAAPNSGGLTAPVAFETSYSPALMTVHGAPGSDTEVIDFADSSATADKHFKNHGSFVINCNHGGGHCDAPGLAVDMWLFFNAHPYGVTPAPWASALPSDFSRTCAIY